jgi:outer membrane protein OmpA-like peptidoglycan-associated protein
MKPKTLAEFDMRKILLATALTALMTAPGFAAEADYTADDVIKFFTDQGANRAICVGTEEECGTQAEKPVNFDLRVNFEHNSDNLTDEAKTKLTTFATAINSPSLAVARFAVEGYTDATGGEQYNLTLSDRRAAAVVDYLRRLGVDPVRLYAKGFGEVVPVGSNPYDPVNRRVEARIIR